MEATPPARPGLSAEICAREQRSRGRERTCGGTEQWSGASEVNEHADGATAIDCATAMLEYSGAKRPGAALGVCACGVCQRACITKVLRKGRLRAEVLHPDRVAKGFAAFGSCARNPNNSHTIFSFEEGRRVSM